MPIVASYSFAIVFSIGIKHDFSCINIRQVQWEVLKTKGPGKC